MATVTNRLSAYYKTQVSLIEQKDINIIHTDIFSILHKAHMHFKGRLYYFLYKTLLYLSNRYNNNLVGKYKLIVGSSLLMLSPSLSAQEKKSLSKDSIPEIKEIPMSESEELDEDILCYLIVERMPEFPGGQEALMEYIASKIKYPPNCEDVEGKVVVQFIVKRDGSTSDLVIIRSLNKEIDNMVSEIILNMPKWSPGYQLGAPVAVKYTIPIIFKSPKE